MWEFIAAMSTAERILYALLILYGTYKGIIHIPWIKWSGKSKRNKSHRNCELYDEVCEVLKALPELYNLPYKIIEDQMSIADDVEQDLRDFLWRHYLKFYREKLNHPEDGILSDMEIKAYDYILRYALNRTKDKIRAFFRENHFAEISEREFIERSEIRAEQIIRMFWDVLNDIYPVKAVVSIDELKDWNCKATSEVKLRLLNLFRKARSISINYFQKKCVLEAELNKVMG